MRLILKLDDLADFGPERDPALSIRRVELAQVLTELLRTRDSDEPEETGREHRPLRLDVLRHRTHSAILVNARRGDGKTTFLTHLLRLIEKGPSSYSDLLADRPKEGASRLYSLGIIDPTLIETKQNIIVMILDRMREAVDHRLKAERGRSAEHENVRRELRNLASGLTLLDGIGGEEIYGRDWADPDYVLQQGLDRARAAGEFERNFYRYTARACRFLDVEAFVIAIDDVDTSFDKGWPVLEAVRKYLATSRLKVVLSGDLGLYNMLVRREQWRQITPEFLKAEQILPSKYQQTERLGQLIEELQDQYLVKIAPVDRRVELRPLNELVAEGALLLEVGGGLLEPRRYARGLARAVVRASLPGDQDAFASAILRLPLRSALRILESGRESVASDEDFDSSPVLEALRQVLSSVLLNRGIDSGALVDTDPRRTMYALTNWLTRHSRWSSGARFTAGTGEEDYDLVAIVVASALVRTFRGRLYAMLEFALRICIVREKVERESLTGTALQQLVAHLWPTALEGPVRFASRLASWDAGTMRTAGGRKADIRLSGAIVPANVIGNLNAAVRRVYGLRSEDARRAALYRERFAEIMDGEDDGLKGRLLAALPVPIRAFHLRVSRQSGNRYAGSVGSYYYSFVNSLGTLRSGLRHGASAILMLGACRIAGGPSSDAGVFSVLRLIATVAELASLSAESLNDAETASRVEHLLNEAALFRSFPSPGREGDRSSDAVQAGGEEAEDDAEPDPPQHRESARLERREVFVEMLSRWAAGARGSRAVASPQTISRIWTRFTYAYDGIQAELHEGQTKYLGVLVHRTIIAFLHAVGVEALRAASQPIAVAAYRNPIASSQPFHRLLREMYAGDELRVSEPEVEFFDHLFTCPLWGYFLARSDGGLVEEFRTDYAAAIVGVYYARMNRADGAETKVSDSSYQVVFEHPENARRPTPFYGFYELLNTIPLEGAAGPSGRINIELGEVLSPPPVVRRRTRQVRLPSDES